MKTRLTQAALIIVCLASLLALLASRFMSWSGGSGLPQHVFSLPWSIYVGAAGFALLGVVDLQLMASLLKLRRRRDELTRRNASLEEAARGAQDELRRLTEAHNSETEALAEIGALSHLDAVVSAGQGEEAILDTIAEIICTAVSAELGLVIYLQPFSNALGVKALSGLHGDSAIKMAEAVKRLRIGHSLPWRAIRERASVCDPEDSERAAGAPGGSGIAAPLMEGDEPFGVVCGVWRHQRHFVAADLERMDRLAKQASLAIQKARQHQVIEEVTFDTILTLADAIEGRAAYTMGHVSRVAEYAEMIARSLHLPEAEVRAIRYGAALHDVGMLAVSDRILVKPGRLTPEEVEQVRMHPYHGSELCKRAGFLEALIPMIYYHHERFDGKGYPEGLRGAAIPLGARIVAVADVFDALSTERPYRKALSEEDAIQALSNEAGHQLDPDLVEAFLEALEERRRHTLAA